MCLVIPRGTQPQSARKDITVYKRCFPTADDKIIRSMYANFEYELGKVYHTPFVFSEIIQNFDQYETEILRQIYGDNLDTMTERIMRGHHSTLRVERLTYAYKMKDERAKNYICRIPKGSDFYVGYTDLVISDHIVIEKVI